MAVESNCRIWASWFETREDALLTMRVEADLFLTTSAGSRPHPEERRMRRVSKDEATMREKPS
jgi:hypothetical protein